MRSLLPIILLLSGLTFSMAGPKPIAVSFIVPAEGWFFEAFADGSVKADYGSSAADSMNLPPGTLDFPKLVEFVHASQKTTVGGDALAGIQHKGEKSLSLKYLRDDSFFRAFFLQHRKDWKGFNGEPLSEHLQKMMLKIKYYEEAEQAGADQPAPKPKDKPPVKGQPSTPTPKVGPR